MHSTQRTYTKGKKALLDTIITSTELKIGQSVMVKNHAHHTFKPKYLLDHKILKCVMAAHSCSLHQWQRNKNNY